MPHRVLVTNNKLRTLRNYKIYVTNNKAPTSWSINPLSSYTTAICRCNMIAVVRDNQVDPRRVDWVASHLEVFELTWEEKGLSGKTMKYLHQELDDDIDFQGQILCCLERKEYLSKSQ